MNLDVKLDEEFEFLVYFLKFANKILDGSSERSL